MMWNTIKLKNCCEKIGSGATPKGGGTVYIPSGTTLIRSQNVYNLHFSYDGLAHISDDAAQKLNSVTVHENDILLNITGDSIARTCLVPKDILPARVNQHVSIVRPISSIIIPQFLSYYLASPYMQKYMLGLSVGKGTSRNAMTKRMIESFSTPVPPLNIQQKIVNILSAYDGLIEVNQKQIRLLEEAARRLYKEWFVDLRFPGHENTSITDGIPAGWSTFSLSQIFNYTRGKSYSSEELSSTKGVYLINLKNINAWGGYKRDAEKRFTGTYSKSHEVKSGDIIMAVTDMTQERRLVGHVALVPVFSKKAIISMDLIKIIPKESVTHYFLYSMLRFSSIAEQISQYANGVNVLHLRPENITQIKVQIPSKDLMMQFEKIVANYYEKIEPLEKQILLLQEARDRLLPKLMSGEIEV